MDKRHVLMSRMNIKHFTSVVNCLQNVWNKQNAIRKSSSWANPFFLLLEICSLTCWSCRKHLKLFNLEFGTHFLRNFGFEAIRTLKRLQKSIVSMFEIPVMDRKSMKILCGHLEKILSFLTVCIQQWYFAGQFFPTLSSNYGEKGRNAINAATRYSVKRKDERGEQEARKKGKAPQ